MTTSIQLGASAFDSDYDANQIDEILRQNDDYILALAVEEVPRHIASPDVLDLEIHELAQRSRIKLWRSRIISIIRGEKSRSSGGMHGVPKCRERDQQV